jgi:hypothetical protein
MNNTRQFNRDFGTTARCAFYIEKVHRCEDCPIHHMAIKRPRSIFARLHRWHKTWWPGWKVHQSRHAPSPAEQ